MSGYVYIRNILDIKCGLVGLFDHIVIFFISCLATSESSATLGQSMSETEVFAEQNSDWVPYIAKY